MSAHRANVEWSRGDGSFVDGRYSRRHRWRFDGGAEVPAAASPEVVPAAYTDASAVDPEEAFVASLASCHMLWFLSQAAKAGFTVDRYDDEAVGTMGRDADGRMAILEVVLYPRVTFSGERQPSSAELDRLHDRAHHACFIAASVKSALRIEPRQP